ncbi:addiction module protein [Asticcacaulis sp. AC402]|uniref:addiction module protein n=1 Tax=Asticcacaulis sp. AC402 TaxID=1282361 RepID=UPI0003C4030A|nr:addiction module protein [Asticcacaulis sp. AC402]ESQ74062.1 hypothetical protein ABAC402_16320 [Asticcacaulis sp. AC402]
MGTLSPDDIKRLSVEERLELIGDLWDSIEAERLPVPDAHRAEIERRLATLDEDIKLGTAWEDLKAEMEARAK